MKPAIRTRAIAMLAAAVVPRLFSIQSIDTMKDSRDQARAVLNDQSYSATIDQEMSLIAASGANYAAIDVPYDDEFAPLLARWVASARSHGLSVWFRGNLSGWEGWFGYPAIGREEHLKGVESFILGHPSLFRDGDIFSGCPECENGQNGSGDPRQTGDVASYRAFMVNEHQVWTGDFAKIGKKVAVISSMNLDVARLVMDKPTTAALGGVVAIDHYATSTAQFESDIVALHQSSGGQIILGEFGGPIPSLNGSMTDDQQTELVRGLLDAMYRHSDIVIGANYWTLRSGSTALVADSLSPKPALAAISAFYSAPYVSGTIRDGSGRAIAGRRFAAAGMPFMTGSDGSYRIFVPQGTPLDAAVANGGGFQVADLGGFYATTTLAVKSLEGDPTVDLVMHPAHPSLWERFLYYFGLMG